MLSAKLLEPFSELLDDAGRTSKLWPALSIGAVLGVLVIIFQISFSAIVFSGPLAPLAIRGVGLLLFGALVTIAVTALASNYKGIISFPMEATISVLAIIGAGVAAGIDGPIDQRHLATMAVIMGATSLVSAAAFLLVGKFRLTNYLRFIPFPVAAGILAATGWILIRGSVSVMTGEVATWGTIFQSVEPSTLVKWGPGVAYGILIFFASRRWGHFLVLPIALVLGIVLYHLALLGFGISITEARAEGLLFSLGGAQSGTLWPPLSPSDLGLVEWGVVMSQMPIVLAAAFVTVIAALVYTNALELSSGVELDTNREFRAMGYAAVAAGLGGSAPGHHVPPLSTMSLVAGAYSRLTPIVAGLVVAFAIFLSGAALEIIPMPLLGSLVFFVGFRQLYTWLFAVRRMLPLVDYGVILVIVGVIAGAGFLQGIAAGLVATVIIFAFRFSRVEVVDAPVTAKDVRSNKRRPVFQRAILADQSSLIQGYRLKGYVFFGSAYPMVDRLNLALESDPAPRCVIVDFADVTGFDVSAGSAIHRFVRKARLKGTRIVATSISRPFRAMLVRGLPIDDRQNIHFEEDFDYGLEWCEDLVIETWNRRSRQQKDARDALVHISRDEAKRLSDLRARFDELAEQLEPYAEVVEFEQGRMMVEIGSHPKGLQLLVSGLASAHDGIDHHRLREYGPGSALTVPAAFGDYESREEIQADENCRLLLLTKEARENLESHDQDLAMKLYSYLLTQTPE